MCRHLKKITSLKMSAQIFNREFNHPADGWYQIETPGEHPNKQGGVVQVIDASSVRSIVNRFNQEADNYAQTHRAPFPGMLIDHEHFKHDADKETRAYGWLLRMENRGGVPFGEIRWTRVGQQAVDGGEYRFFSSEYAPGDLEQLGGNKVRPMRLAGLTLTNQPNNKGGQPITNRDTSITTQVSAQPAQRIPTEESEAWLNAVGAIQRGIKNATRNSVSFQTAWDMCKQQHPDIYAAAFFNGTISADAVGTLVNRIRAAAGYNFETAWNFVRENLPRIFNRQFGQAAPVQNREGASSDARAIQAKAAKLFGALANKEQLATKSDFSTAWKRIANREPVLHKLVNGKCTPDEAFAEEPTLRNRLV
jgi:hypothetical protein